jgi:ferredoxin
MAARDLTAGFDVTVLEAGDEFKPFDGNLDRYARARSSRLLRDPRLIRLLFPSMHVTMTSGRMPLVYGMATGGTTTLATGNALRADEGLQKVGIDLGSEYDALYKELPISTGHERRWRPVTRELFAACATLGLDPVVTPKLVDYSRCTRCGRCVLGCSSGAKWDSREHLGQAVGRGATLLTGTTVEHVVTTDGERGSSKATGVLVRRHGRREFIPADLVVLAAGGLGTPALLAGSGIKTEDRLFVDPVLCVAAHMPASRMDEEVPMPFFVEGDGYILSPYFDYLSFFFSPGWRRPRHEIAALMIKLADTEAGSVDGRRRVVKELSVSDGQRLSAAQESCVEIFARLGVPRGSIFLGLLNAGHPGGTLPLSERERDTFHADQLPENVYVADASLLPNSLGKPPILTIMALARRVASVCLERFAQ